MGSYVHTPRANTYLSNESVFFTLAFDILWATAFLMFPLGFVYNIVPADIIFRCSIHISCRNLACFSKKKRPSTIVFDTLLVAGFFSTLIRFHL